VKAFAPVPQAFAPVPQAFAPVPQAFAPVSQAFASMPQAFAPVPQAFAPVPQAFAPVPQAFASVSWPDLVRPPTTFCVDPSKVLGNRASEHASEGSPLMTRGERPASARSPDSPDGVVEQAAAHAG
jgi:hypothetical protein